MKCRNCGSSKVQKRGKTKDGNTRLFCKSCKTFPVHWQPRHSRSARILLLDIETLPGEYYAFDPKVEYLTADKQIKDWSVSCWAAKWLFEPETMGEVVSGKDAVKRSDASIMGGMWKLIDQADIVITQNGIKFDIKKLNTRFLLHGYPPPSHYLNVDTLKVAKDVFGFSYNRLDELGKKFGIGEKTKMTFEDDWRACVEGDDEKLGKMLAYCKRDVAPLLEDVYLKMLPWIHNHPNLNIFTSHDSDVCPKCESTDLSWNTTYKTPAGLWNGFRCNACGGIGRGTTKKNNIKSVAIK